MRTEPDGAPHGRGGILFMDPKTNKMKEWAPNLKNMSGTFSLTPSADPDPSPAAVPATAPSKGKKRKSEETELSHADLVQQLESIDDDDPRVRQWKHTPQQLRARIRRLIDSKEMTIKDFCSAIGNSQKSYRNFVSMHGTHAGGGSDTYLNASLFFNKLDVLGIKLPRKKQRTSTSSSTSTSTSAAAGASTGTTKGSSSTPNTKKDREASDQKFDVTGIELEDWPTYEDEGKVPIFETCDSLRRALNAHLRSSGMTIAQLARHLKSQLPPEGDVGGSKAKSVQGTQLTKFLGSKGPRTGAESAVFYTGYIYLEKLRIKQGKPKSSFREEMEDEWEMAPGGPGFPRYGANTRFIVPAGSGFSFDKYGKTGFW